MADTKTYLYSVNPRKTVSGLSTIKPFRSPRSLFLTLDDVKVCLEKATVYRRFANEGKFEKVTIGNCERLHHDHFMDEKEYEQFKINELSKDSSTVKKEPEKVVEKKVEEPKKEKVEEKKEEAKKENDSEILVGIYESDDEEVVEKVEE